MSNLTRHLPQLGVLVLSAALAAGAYSVYADQTGGSSPGAREAAGLTIESPASAAPAAKARGRDHSSKRPHEARELASVGPSDASPVAPAWPAPAIAPAPTQVTTKPFSGSGPPPESRGDGDGIRDEGPRDRRLIDEEHLGDDDLDRELKDIGKDAPPPSPGTLLTPPPATGTPEQQTGDPVEPTPSDPSEPAPSEPAAPEPDDPAAPEPDDPAAPEPDDPAAPEPDDPAAPTTPSPDDDPATTPPTTQPDPSAAPDPDSGLDDTPVGGLDQTDLGTPVDEAPASGPTTAPTAGQSP